MGPGECNASRQPFQGWSGYRAPLTRGDAEASTLTRVPAGAVTLSFVGQTRWDWGVGEREESGMSRSESLRRCPMPDEPMAKTPGNVPGISLSMLASRRPRPNAERLGYQRPPI